MQSPANPPCHKFGGWKAILLKIEVLRGGWSCLTELGLGKAGENKTNATNYAYQIEENIIRNTVGKSFDS